MQKDWGDLPYLLHSTAAQQATSHTLEALRVFPFPGHSDPMLAGTIPPDMAIVGGGLARVCAGERGHHGGIR